MKFKELLDLCYDVDNIRVIHCNGKYASSHLFDDSFLESSFDYGEMRVLGIAVENDDTLVVTLMDVADMYLMGKEDDK